MKLSLFLFSFVCLFSVFGQKWFEESKSLFNHGFHDESLALIEKNISKKKTGRQKSQHYLLIADNYYKKVEINKFYEFSNRSFKCIENKTALDSALYYSNISDYYHSLLRTDSATFYADQSFKILSKNVHKADSSLISRIYMVYGNSMRNGIVFDKNMNQWQKGDPISNKRKTPIKYLTIALQYSNDFEKPYILKRLGNTYNDLISLKPYSPKNEIDSLFKICVFIYKEAIEIAKKTFKNPNLFLANVNCLLGLTFQYNDLHKEAMIYYNRALKYALNENRIKFLYEFNLASSWKGWNYEEWYEKSKDPEHLKRALKVYEETITAWESFYAINHTSKKGFHDGYRVSVLHKIAHVCYSLHEITNEEVYIRKFIEASEKDRYLTYPRKKDRITLNSIQKILEKEEVLIYYTATANPNAILCLLISKNKFQFLSCSTARIELKADQYTKLYGLNSIEKFKSISFRYYKRLFQPIDSILTKWSKKDVIVIPSNGFSLLNFDLLISDTTAQNWKSQPYLFHKYSFSYALSLNILLDSYVKRKAFFPNSETGILYGEFEDQTNLIFSRKLAKNLVSKYSFSMLNPKSKRQTIEYMRQFSTLMLIGHGQGTFHNSKNQIYINDSIQIDSDELYKLNLDNELVITTTCLSGRSDSYFSEGVSGGFTKSLMYAGVKSSITTLWEVDDKTNAIILEKYFDFLQMNYSKSRSLWLAKKNYWKTSSQDEEFKPFYWSPYRLTGKTSPIQLFKAKKKSKLPLIILFSIGILIVGIGVSFLRAQILKK